MYNILSYGAGVQTFGMLCLIKLSRLEKPDLVIFSDTRGEKPATYEHIENVAKPLCEELGLKFVAVSRGDLLLDSFARGNTPRPPYCSWMYKRDIINKYLKQEGYTPAVSWIGISTDESHRGNQKSAVSWVTNRYPLLELNLSRFQVKEAIKEAGYTPPVKSGCWFCPWNSGKGYWLALKQNDPERFKLAVLLEKQTGHSLSNGPFWLNEIDNQEQINWDDIAEIEDVACTTGQCFV